MVSDCFNIIVEKMRKEAGNRLAPNTPALTALLRALAFIVV